MLKLNRRLPTIATVIVLTITGPPAAIARDNLLGQEVSGSAADYTMLIRPGTRYANVTRGDTVTFDSGAGRFTWKFDGGQNVTAFNLGAIAPQGMLDHSVRVYIAPNPADYGA